MRRLAIDIIAEHLRVHGRLTQRLLIKGTGLAKETVSTNLAKLVESGCVVRTSSVCNCCGNKVDNFDFMRHPVAEVRRPRAKPTRKPKAPQPAKPAAIKPPVYDGSVFGLMAAQLGATK